MRSKPEHTLPRQAVSAWRISGAIQSLFIWLAPLGMLLFYLAGEGPPLWSVILVIILALFLAVLLILLLPYYRWRRWRYQIDEHEVDLFEGVFFHHRTLVPVKRVQHVDTRQGPVLRRYGLSNVVISTAATSHEIPMLDEETADHVRDQISKFARLAKEDV